MANTAINPRHVRIANGNATTAEVNTGKVIVPDRADRQIVVIGGYLRALGGNASGATSVDITDTATSPVAAFSAPIASLTSGTIVDAKASGNTNANLGVGLTPGKGLKIAKTGANLATATSVDYCVEYVYV